MRLIDVDKLMGELEREVEMADDWKTAHEIANVVKYAPTIESVPLEPLCQWLAGYAVPPDYALEYVIGTNAYWQDAACTEENMKEAWEYHFRNLFGLMDTEESDADHD